jgi:cell division protein FtsB
MIARFKKNENWQRRKRNFFSIMFFLFVGIGVILITSWLIVGNLKIDQKRKELDLKISSLKEEIQKLQDKEAFLQSQIFRTEKEEKEYLEEVARDDFGLKQEEEKAVAIIFEPDKEEPDQDDNVLSEKGSIWQKIFQGIRDFFIK